MRLRPQTAFALAACLLAAHAAAAQAPQREPPVRLSLKVVFGARGAPTFYPLPDEDKKGSGAVFGVGGLSSARLLGGPPVDTLSLGFAREGDGARVTVYVHRGSEAGRESLKVAECFVGEGQGYTLSQLASYGVEPVSLSVVRRVEVELAPPRVENRTKAVEVSEVKVHPEAPSFELVLRNASDKDVRAVELEEYRGMERKGPPPMYNWRDAPPLKPGKTFSVTLEFGWNGKATAEGHAVEPPDRVNIRSVLFTDGTYEGGSLFAAHAEAFREGRRVQLKRVLGMFGESGEAPADYAFIQGLVTRVEMLDAAADWPAVNEFAGRYNLTNGQELERLKREIEEGMRRQREIVLGDLNNFLRQASSTSDPAAAQRWLKTMREAGEKLLNDI